MENLMESFIFCAVVGLQTAGCNATKNKILTEFLQGLLEILENVQEEESVGKLPEKCF